MVLYLDLSGPMVRTGSMQSVVLHALKKNMITNMTAKINAKLLTKGILSWTMPATHNVPPVNTIFWGLVRKYLGRITEIESISLVQ